MSAIDSIKEILGKSAPLVGSLIAGPAGGAIGALVASKLGVENTPESISLELSGNPNAVAKIKELELQNKAEFKRMAIDLAKSEIMDTQHAREHNKHSRMPALICGYLTVALTVFVGLLMKFEIPEDNQQLVYMLLGSYLTAWLSSIAYWVGTTRSSSEKDKSNLLPKSFRK